MVLGKRVTSELFPPGNIPAGTADAFGKRDVTNADLLFKLKSINAVK